MTHWIYMKKVMPARLVEVFFWNKFKLWLYLQIDLIFSKVFIDFIGKQVSYVEKHELWARLQEFVFPRRKVALKPSQTILIRNQNMFLGSSVLFFMCLKIIKMNYDEQSFSKVFLGDFSLSSFVCERGKQGELVQIFKWLLPFMANP